jgi:hypothetical protein
VVCWVESERPAPSPWYAKVEVSSEGARLPTGQGDHVDVDFEFLVVGPK